MVSPLSCISDFLTEGNKADTAEEDRDERRYIIGGLVNGILINCET